ncbi:uncharacterized protein TRAVEDRAFT_20734 [Trametes versicolor FP-101664 SS1]|uniref:uncharacterized protein n=1 Tax=Trametes versicolor (strain FP-101664) TaxID=717944 RepID=UPI00046227C1|nr:uncharacterized protein TRAVEDRAFT_20734 [Trametes versicolor FP-101664 SS1]EIW58856.1 hypothetical protein TRAVEDRAFT_20734 [Trametes versicolor FP-101664 SS1]
MSSPVPVETIEHTISFLRGDIPSLAACSLTCHALLPISRVHLWHEIVLPVKSDGSHSTRTETFLDLLDCDSAIALYVRSLGLRPENAGCSHGEVSFNRAALDALSARLPALLSLRLHFLVIPSLYDIMILLRDLPALETLCLHSVSLGGDNWLSRRVPAWPEQPVLEPVAVGGQPPSPWALRTLSLIGGSINGEEVTQLALFLERSRSFMPKLDWIDFCCAMLPTGPGVDAVLPEVPRFVPSLRHFGITLSDLHYDGISVQGHLPRCSSLTSLYLRYDRRIAYLGNTVRQRVLGTPQPYTPTPFFIEHLADVLSAGGPTPLPLLETLSLVFDSPTGWLVGFEAAFARLAKVLVGTTDDESKGARGETVARRYPRFAHLHVRTSFLGTVMLMLGEVGMEEQRGRQEAERVDLVLPMLARFVRAGVHVEITCD